MSKQNIFGGDILEPEEFSSEDRGDAFDSLGSLLEPEPAPVIPEEPPAETPPPSEPEEPTPSEPSEPPTEEPEPPAEDPENKPTDKQLIPRARFNELNDQKKAAENRVKELEARLNSNVPPTQYDFDAKEKDYMDAVLEGDHTKALSIRKEIRAAEMDLARTVATQTAAQAKDATKAELDFESTVASIESEYSAFDQTSHEYNQDLVDEALELHAGFVSRGYTPAAAMKRAVGYVAKANGLVGRSQQESLASSTATTSPAAPPKTPSTVKSKLDLAASQPPVQAGTSGGEVTPNYAQLSDEEWDALPASTLARLRGDTF
jgi:hypothetical protein